MDYILGFVILLGVLIFIHEFGHFITAKYFKMRVEVFSIGMGKKLFSKIWGETEYSLSLFPIGGYVKITGQDPREEIAPENEARAFKNKPLYQRTLVVLAGPLFNAALAYLIFMALFAKGLPTQDAVLPRILPESPAYLAGFRSNDRVLSVTKAGEKLRIRQFSDFDEVIAESVDQDLAIEVEHKDFINQTTKTETLAFRPILGKEKDLQLPVTKDRGVMLGLERSHVAPVLSVLPKSWAETQKIPQDFWVKELRFVAAGVEDSIKVESFEEFERAWTELSLQNAESTSKGEIRLKGILTSDLRALGEKAATTEPQETTIVMTWTRKEDRPPTKLLDAGFVSSEFRVAGVLEKSPADKMGLKKDDLLLALNDNKILSFNTFKSAIQDFASEKKSLKISLLRSGEILHKEVQAVEVSNEDPDTGSKSKQFQIGVQFTSFPAMPALTQIKSEGLFDNLALAWQKFVRTNATMVGTFYHLARGEISGKSLGGPILIGKIAGDSFRAGGVQFLQMMSFLSLNLFIFNLLPIPVLDGGHLVLFAIVCSMKTFYCL